MTLEEMGARMSAWEFAHHLADYQRSPWGEDRADLRSALVAATIVNTTPFRKKGTPPAKVQDFLLFNSEEVARTDGNPEEIRDFIMGKS